MPLTRCLIRNEYGLGDPELYKVADKDDPEALLEGVAMAGLVGVLRQLGDLAQFAAEIFHDLHEEVMSTATRGHSLIVRVQQLEVEFPSVEKTLLSQTCHTAFLYNSGVEWHPNLRADQNLVIREDLPRFVMDSYEECRGPPRLFLLDKFDVAGAGACLKRYSDPSFFKVETTSSTGRKLEGQREKKIRRVKKRGLLGRNGDTPETFSSSHVKLHQLFLEESIETGVYVPERRIKLKKRQLSGSLFDQDKGKSYMEKFLDASSPEQKIVHEKYIDPLPLTWTSGNGCDSGLDIVEIGTVTPLKKSILTDQSACSSPDTMDVVVKPSINDFSEAARVTDCNDESNAGMILPAISKIVNGEESADGESKSEVGPDHNSVDAASEIDNYIDARAFIDSEVETDSECKRNRPRLNLKPVVVESDTSEGSDALSVGNSITSEDSSNFFRERESSSCSVSMDTLAETTPDLGASAVVFPSASASNLDGDKMSADRLSMSEEIPGNEPEKHAAWSGGVVEADDASKSVQEICEVSHSSCITDQNALILPIDGEGSLRENCLPEPDPNKVSSSSAEPDFKSELCYQGCANQSISWSCNGKVPDASKETLGGNWSHGELTMPNTAYLNSSACSGNSSDPFSTHGFVDLLQTESKKPCSSDSSIEEHSNDLGTGEVNVCLDIVPSLADSPFSVATYPETAVPTDMASETIDLASNANFCVTSSELICASQPSAADFLQNSGVQEQLPETMIPALTPLPEFAPGASPEDPIIKEVFADIQNGKEASSDPIVGQTELSPTISSRLQTFASFADAVSPGNERNNELLSGSADGETRGITVMGNLSHVSDLSETQEQWDYQLSEKFDAALSELHVRSEKEVPCAPTVDQSEIWPPISVKPQTCDLWSPSEIVNKDGTDVASVVSPGVDSNSELLAEAADGEIRSNTIPTGNPFPVIVSSKPPEQLQKLPSVKTDAALLEHKLIETEKQYPGNETDTDGQSVFLSGDECNAVNVAAVARDVVYLDYSETRAGEADATSDHGHNVYQNDKRESVALDVFPFDRPSKLEHDSNCVSLPYHHDLAKVADTENSHYEKTHEEPASVTEGFYQNEEELPLGATAELDAQKHVDSVQGAFENLNSNLSCMSTDGSPTLASFNGPLAGCVPNHGKSDIVEAPLTNESSNQDVALNPNEIHPLKRQEDNVELLSNNLVKHMIPPTTGLDLLDGESIMKPLHADELFSQSINYAMQIQGPLYCPGVATVSQLQPQSAEHTLECFTEPMMSTSVFPGNYMINSNNLATHKIENSEQPVYPRGFPILGVLPTEPQINLDSPPLPPLPPMQWRLSRFQNSSPAADSQMAPHVSGAVQSVPSTVSEMPSQNIKCEIRVENLSFTSPSMSIEPQEGNQVSAEQQGVFTQPMFHNTSAAPEEQMLRQTLDPEQPTPATVMGVSSHNRMNEMRIEDNGNPYNGSQVLADSYVAQQGVAMLPVLPSISDVSSASNLDGVRREENLILTPSSSYQNGNQIAEDSYHPRVNHHEREPLVEGNSSAHIPAVVEVKADMESAVQDEPLVLSRRDTEEAISSDFQLIPPSKIEPTSGFMVPESGKSWSSNDDGSQFNPDSNVNGILQKKPARPRNPLIDEVVAIDKSKLRKVERLKSSVELKPEGWGPLLEQMQLRKVDRVNPTVETKVEEGKYEMEHLQLRKAGARANPQVELKTENRNSLLEQLQLRKVGERVKPETEEKSEETESPRLLLRKVGERMGESYKPEAEEKPVETESPRVLLRKVGERSHPLVRSKTEDRNSLLEQIKNKSFNLRPAALTRPNIQASNIQGPRTNLKVAAMLEKASNIRQAMAGSDEEDDADTWSDC